ncbi:MAG: neutral/alkaline non-lysosomal ceramidase N-terminal domain-containing protein [Deltaproteobacteria bacterium]|nr:neutral/alkaline non-lysosomal ceramidase N-terminal domain-containing protein [Deltaproteobacteria bacterium]
MANRKLKFFIFTTATVAILALWAVACDDQSEVVPPGSDGGISQDGSVTPDGGNGEDKDAGFDDVAATACSYLSDCPKADCIQGVCKAAQRCHCDPVSDIRCLCGATSQGDTQCEPYKFCYDGRMVTACKTDADCPQNPDKSWCLNGLCEPYLFEMNAPEPNAGGTKGALKAGYAEVLLDFPVGVSMAGYGGRKGPKTPYAKEMGGSTGFYDRPLVKALALDNGAERIVFLRHASAWTTDYTMTMTAKKLADRLGENYMEKIIATTGHSHSYPARFWTVAYGMGMGVFGYDEFMWEIFDRITTSYAAAVENAVLALAPARIGWATDDDFDPENRITHGRGESTFGPNNKDRALLVLRVDNVGGPNDGKPMAVLMRYGTHGTEMNDTLISGDAPIAAEMICEQGFERDLGYHVPVMHINGDGGNTSPAGDWGAFSRNDLLSIQEVGHWAYTLVRSRYDSITESRTDIDMKVVSKWLPLDRESIGYSDDEFYLERGGAKKPYWNGAFQCANGYKEGGWKDGALGCLLVMDDLNYGACLPEFSFFRISAARIGDLLLATLPGEPTTNLGKKTVDGIKEATGLSDVFTVGYSQDHHLYILTEPDWFKGSYESSMDIWGFREGEYMSREAVSLATALKDLGNVPEINSTVHPSWYFDVLEKKTVTPSTTTEGTLGQFYVQPPASIAKGAVVTVEWHGGHPGVDTPRVFLEAKDGNGQWSTLKTPGGRDYDDTHFQMIIEYLGNYKGKHDWKARWQELVELKAGTYRIRADGHHYNGSAAESYAATSGDFNVAEGTIEIRDLAKDAGKLVFKVNYSAPPSGTFRLNSVHVPITLGAPLDIVKQVAVNMTCGTGNYSKPDIAPALSSATEKRNDGGRDWDVLYTSLSVPDIGDGSCEYDITVTDPWGNTGNLKKKL